MAARIAEFKINNLLLPDERCLSAHEIERLAGIRAGDKVICTHGILWVTQEGDPQDHLLRQGQRFVAERPGVIVVEAMSEGACVFSQSRIVAMSFCEPRSCIGRLSS